MKKLEYLYKKDNIIHLIQAKISENSKIGIGYVVQTYHFSIDQVKTADIKQDEKNCLDCPLSFSNGGGCYTHKGMQLMGLKSMLRRLNKLERIDEFNSTKFNAFTDKVKNTYPVDLVRFGAYGEAVLMGEKVVRQLSKLGKKTTGYTHQWKTEDFASTYLMASVHNEAQRIEAKEKGFRSFSVIKKGEKVTNSVNCPASKESGKNLTCVLCGLCNGASKGNTKDVFILSH